MRYFKILSASLSAAVLLAACGGDSSPVALTSMVSFGDSLSDVGTYKVGTVAALGGGKYTVNSASARNWTELVAVQAGQSAPCAAQTGLDGDPAQGFSVAPTHHAGCLNYAQGGARVTDPIGPGHKALGGANAVLGQLTVPLVTQVSRHLAITGGFNGHELVTVMAGGNDAIIQTETFVGSVQAYGAGATAPVVAALASAASAAMTTAGNELAALIKNQIVAKGARQVLVVNLPNLSLTPYGTAKDALTPGSKAVINNLVLAFNTALQTGLAGTNGVRIVDAYTSTGDQIANPAKYGLSNATTPACGANALEGRSLVCNASNVIAGDVSRYMFADDVHLTPFGYDLLAQLVTQELIAANWL